MRGMYALRMNHSFGSSFVRHLQMELVIYDGVPDRNEVVSSEETLRSNADAKSVFLQVLRCGGI